MPDKPPNDRGRTHTKPADPIPLGLRVNTPMTPTGQPYPIPFVWTADPGKFIAAVKREREALDWIH